MMNVDPISDMLNTLSSSKETEGSAAEKLRKRQEEEQKEAVNPVGPAKLENDRFEKSDGKTEETPGVYRLETDESGIPKIVAERPAQMAKTAAEDAAQGAPAEAEGAARGVPAEAEGAAQGAPAKAEDAARQPEPADPKEGGEEPEEDPAKPGGEPKKKVPVTKSSADDSAVEAELAKLRAQKQQIEGRMQSADEDERKALQSEAARLDGEISAKDSKAYRKANITVRVESTSYMDADDAANL